MSTSFRFYSVIGNENLFAPTGLNIKNIGNSTVSIALNWHSLNNAHILGQSSVMVTRILCVCGWLVQYWKYLWDLPRRCTSVARTLQYRLQGYPYKMRDISSKFLLRIISVPALRTITY